MNQPKSTARRGSPRTLRWSLPKIHRAATSANVIDRSRRRLKFAIAGALLFDCLFSGACARTEKHFDTLTFLTLSQPEHIDPRFPEDALGAALGRLVHPGLTATDPLTFRPKSSLASSLRYLDQTHIVVELDRSATFQNGNPVTAQDIVATYASVLDPASTSRLHSTYSRTFRAVEALGPRSVGFTLHHADGAAMSLLGLGIVPVANAQISERLARTGAERGFIGAGPFRVTDLTRGRWRFASTRNGPSLNVLTLRDPNTLALRLLHGQGDLAELKPDLVGLFAHDTEIAISAAPTSGVTYIGIHCGHRPLDDPRVRRALALAIDREALMRARLGRYGVAATGPLPPTHWAYTADVPRYSFDPARARALLASAGIESQPGAQRTRLTFRVSSQRTAIISAQAIAAMLGDVGISVDIRPTELATLLADLRAGHFDLTLLTIPDLSDPWGLGFWFASNSIPTPEHPGAGGNRWRFSDPRLDAVLAQGLRQTDPALRAPFYHRAQRILAEQLPVIPLWHADVVWALRRPWSNLVPRGDGMLDFVTDIRRALP